MTHAPQMKKLTLQMQIRVIVIFLHSDISLPILTFQLRKDWSHT